MALAISLTALGQQNMKRVSTPPASPDIQDDGTVTFRYYNPKAVSVVVEGGCINGGRAQMEEVAPGAFEYVTPAPVSPQMYYYNYVVDGRRVIDDLNPWVIRDVNYLFSVLLVKGGLSDDFVVKDVPHGTVSKVWYHSDKAGFDRRMTVYTPAGYETSKKKYPVVYILHGMGGDEEAWVTQGRACQILDNLIADGRCKPAIAVFTNGNISVDAAPGESARGYDKPNYNLPQTMEGSFEESFPEVVKFIDGRYRTIAKQSSRAICGLSMGGYHTLYISANNPKMFGYVGLFSAAITPRSDSPVYQDIDAKLVAQFAAKPYYFIGIGKDDFLYQDNVSHRQRLDTAGHPYEYMETSGDHNWINWKIYLHHFLQKLF